MRRRSKKPNHVPASSTPELPFWRQTSLGCATMAGGAVGFYSFFRLTLRDAAPVSTWVIVSILLSIICGAVVFRVLAKKQGNTFWEGLVDITEVFTFPIGNNREFEVPRWRFYIALIGGALLGLNIADWLDLKRGFIHNLVAIASVLVVLGITWVHYRYTHRDD